MTLAPKDAEKALLAHFGEPAKPATDYVIGFRTKVGRVLAIHRTIKETLIWFQPPTPPEMPGIVLLSERNNGNSNLNGPLASLKRADTLRVEISDLEALKRFIAWYEGGAFLDDSSHDVLEGIDFSAAFARFQDLISSYAQPFTRFDEGLIAAWESYKPRLRDVALDRLQADTWTSDQIGSGEIVTHVINAIEIQATHGDLTNNLVFWQNRYGHANRDHRALIEAATTGTGLATLEKLLFELYRGGRPEGEIFDELTEVTGAKYPLLAYLYFLKDMDRFMPIQPTGFDRVFAEIGFDFRTLRNCSWSNYSHFVELLKALREPIGSITNLDNVRLVDAHSLLWLFSTLLKKEGKGELSQGAKASEKHLGSREKSIAEIKYSVGRTVFNSNGQTVETKVKNKELRMSDEELDKLLRELLDVQGDRCAITGLPLQFRGSHSDENMLASLDRIDSSGHYERGNLQVVCRFINFWKQASDDAEFRRLINIVRDLEDAEA